MRVAFKRNWPYRPEHKPEVSSLEYKEGQTYSVRKEIGQKAIDEGAAVLVRQTKAQRTRRNAPAQAAE